MTKIATAFFLTGSLISTPAFAADMMVKAPAAAVADYGNWYVWADGTYDRVPLPKYSLGFHSAALTGGGADAGPVQSFDPHVEGGGARGGIGYRVPASVLKFEVDGSFVSAHGSNSATNQASPGLANVNLLGGSLGGVYGCSAGSTCPVNSSLTTSYNAWRVNGKVAADGGFGSITITPSIGIFAGSSHATQSLAQTFTQFFGGGISNSGSYNANTALRWNDFGASGGLDFAIPFATAWSAQLGGWIGFAERRTSLNGSDTGLTSGITFVGSTLSTDRNTSAFLANVEGALVNKLSPAVTARVFAGLNFDSSVPGISAPSYAGGVVAPVSTPANIYYANETSFYAGGGLRWNFGG